MTSAPIAIRRYATRLRDFAAQAHALSERERVRVRDEIMRIPGLMTLLMKPRLGEPWSIEERTLLRQQLKGLGVLGLYIGILTVPGTTVMLPLLAWWLDKRRDQRRLSADTEGKDTNPPTPPA